VFYENGKIVSISKNPSQENFTQESPKELVEKYKNLPSIYYTVDFAELVDGTWKVIEAGDGSVSGLSEFQDAEQYFRALYDNRDGKIDYKTESSGYINRRRYYLKNLRKIFSIIMMALMVFGIFSMTGCSFFNTENDSQGFSKTRLEKLEDTVDTVVEDYFDEKYGVEAVVTYKGIAGGVFLGPDPSSVQYYLVTVNIANGDIVEKYYVEVHGRETEGIDELYVKSESYYGQVIKERMEEWLDEYVNNINIVEYYSSFFSAATNLFSSEYDVDASAEEIIKLVSSIGDIKERPDLTLYVIIPQSEYEKLADIENEFLELNTHINEINGKVNVSLAVYSDEDYLKEKNGDVSNFENLEKIVIID